MLSNKEKELIQIGLVVVVALSVNETVKYFINECVKYNEKNNYYYIAYVVISILLALAIMKVL